MKICPRCEQELQDTAFTQRIRSNGNINLQAYCKMCEKTYKREYYLRHHDKYKAKAKVRAFQYKQHIRDFLLEYFDRHPCVDCGETDPVVLEFDHRDATEKVDCVGTMISNKKPLGVIKAEIEKCDVRCANCHRRKTAKEFGWLKQF